MKKTLILWTLLLAACTTAPHRATQADERAPYYRVFRGVKLADLDRAEFEKKLEESFIPALPAAHAGKGLLAYLPALPPAELEGKFPDELAIVAYESEETYRRLRATPEGQAYADLHWTVFDRAKTQSGSTTPFAGEVLSEVPYDVLSKPVDWQSGYSTLYIGRRIGGGFLPWLGGHARDVARAFEPMGLRGYIFVANDDWEIAFQNWESEQALQRAMETPDGKRIQAEAGAHLKHRFWKGEVPFAGKVAPGNLYNVRFP